MSDEKKTETPASEKRAPESPYGQPSGAPLAKNADGSLEWAARQEAQRIADDRKMSEELIKTLRSPRRR